MGMFEPLIKHSGDEPRLPRESPEPRLRRDVRRSSLCCWLWRCWPWCCWCGAA